MKTLRLLLILILIPYSIYSQNKDSLKSLLNFQNFSLFENENISMDIKAIDPNKGQYGLDYYLNMSRKIQTIDKDSNKKINFEISSKGFVTLEGKDNTNNSIISEVKFKGFPLYFISPKKENITLDWENEDANIIDESKTLANKLSSPLWVFADIHAKHESSQDFRSFDFAFGGQISLTTSYLNEILDFPFSLLRAGKNNNPRQLDLSVGYDYVIGIEKTNIGLLKDGSNYMNRLNFKAEWETGILSASDRIIILVDSFYDLQATEAQKKANKAWNLFYMVKLEHIIGFNRVTGTLTKVALKYTNGSLPPNFEEGYVIGGGFSFEF